MRDKEIGLRVALIEFDLVAQRVIKAVDRFERAKNEFWRESEMYLSEIDRCMEKLNAIDGFREYRDALDEFANK